jgi:hypothetical protein
MRERYVFLAEKEQTEGLGKEMVTSTKLVTNSNVNLSSKTPTAL